MMIDIMTMTKKIVAKWIFKTLGLATIWIAFCAAHGAAQISVYNPPGLDTVTAVSATTTTSLSAGGGVGDSGCTITDAGAMLCDSNITASAYFGDGSNLTGITQATPTLNAVVTAGNTASSTIYTSDLVVTEDLHLPLTTGRIYFDAGTDTLSLWGDAGRIVSYTPFYWYTAAAAPNLYIENVGTGNGITIAESGGGAALQASNSTSGATGYLGDASGRGIYAYGPIAAQFDAWGAGSTAMIKLLMENYYGSIGVGTDMINGIFDMAEATGDIMDIKIRRGGSQQQTFTINHDGQIAAGIGAAIQSDSGIFMTSATSTVGVRVQNTNDAASGTQMILEHTPPLAAAGDWPGRYIVRSGANDISDIYTQIEDATGASTDTSMHFRIMDDGALTELFSLDGNGTNTVSFDSLVTANDISVGGSITAAGYFYGDGTTLTGVVTSTATRITYPYMIYSATNSDFLAGCSAIVYDGIIYNQNYTQTPNSGFTIFADENFAYVYIGTVAGGNHPEPQRLIATDMDGLENVDALLIHTGGNNTYQTVYVSESNTASLSSTLVSWGWTVDLTIEDIFTSNGATSDYTFDLSAITGAGASLWGGDGAGGERSTISAGALTADSITLGTGDILDTYEEGTWTPALSGGTITGDCAAGTTASGYYTKIGKNISANGSIVVASCAVAPTGSIRVSLPAYNTKGYGGCSIGLTHGMSLTASNVLVLQMVPSTQYFTLRQYPVGGGASSDMPDSDLIFTLYFSCNYYAD